ncbi:NAD(P)H-binding protein [Eikenella sp. S3360]|uniref:NAD(P)H-binding protein n=1 Tax=Eikenella glucosivorans TaxID=2766967 RepID=A0ABS0N9R4_9NEIS|nr:NAD(P)H-binding protein [Eikenella glucosivorans]MBH5329047.1 NAD(P)H-binding protein [Eikenella glucosivorans]
MAEQILVLSATGNVGKFVVQALLNKGVSVKAASRRGENIGAAQGVKFDFDDESTWNAALENVSAAYVMLPMGYANQDKLNALLKLMLEKGIKPVLQTATEHFDSPENPNFHTEKRLEQSGKPYVILRPTWFMDNFNILWRADLQKGVLTLPLHTGKSALIDVRDIADCAVAALTSDKFNGKAFNLTGGELKTYAEMVEILAEHSGLPLRFDSVTPEQYAAKLKADGFPDAGIPYFLKVLADVENGSASIITDDVQTLTGHAPRTLADFAKDNADKWRA